MLWIICTIVLAVVFAFGAACFFLSDSDDGKTTGVVFGALATALWLVVTGFFSFTTVDVGYAATFRSFNTVVEDEVRGSSVGWRAPWHSVDIYEVRRREIPLVDANTISGAAEGGVHVEEFDVIIPFELRPEHLWLLRREVGPTNRIDALIYNSARSAARDTLANFTWDELAYLKRDEASQWLSDRFMAVLTADLVSSGLPEDAASNVLRAYTAQIREVRVPTSILNANANLAASRVELERQAVLTQIAEQEAQRRSNEGTGIQQMWANLPDATASDIALILDAVSNKTRADALAQAVQDGQVTVMVLNGQESAAPVR